MNAEATKLMNPWVRLPDTRPFVLSEDADAVAAIQARANADLCPHTELLPEPFGGNPSAPVVLLDSHPGFSPVDQAAHQSPTYAAAIRDSLALVRSDWPLIQLDPRFEDTPAGRYSRHDLFPQLKGELQRRLGGSDEEAWRHLSRSVLFVHHFPYHRKRGANHRVESQAFGFHLVREAIARNALVVIRNAEKRWFADVPELQDHPRRCRSNAPLVPSLSRGNLPDDWFDRLVEALLETPSAVHAFGPDLTVTLPEGLPPTERLRVLRQIDAVVRDARFRERVIAAWGAACAVCGLELVGIDGAQECEVAHVVPVAQDGPDALANGLPLCRTHHWAFDEHLWAIEPDSRRVHTREEYRDEACLGPYHGSELRGTGVTSLGRDRLLARWHSFKSRVSPR